MLKLYIAVLEEVPDNMVPVLVAHSMLGAHLEWIPVNTGYHGDSISYYTWLKDSFKKVVLKVNKSEFTKISALRDVYLGHENSVLNGSKTCAVVYPTEIIPNVLKFAKMWKPTYYTPSSIDGR